MPYSEEAEKGVLSCFLLNPMELIIDFHGNGGEEMMYHPAHRCLFGVMLELVTTAKPVDLVSLSHALTDRGLLGKTGGASMLAELYSFVPTPAHYPYYKQILLEKLAQRTCITVCTEIIQKVYEIGTAQHEDHGHPGEELMDWRSMVMQAQSRLYALTQTGGRQKRFVQVKEVMHRVFDHINEAISNKGHVTHGIATGFTDLDRTLMGLKGGQLFVIGGRTSMGKSALAANIAESAALADGHYGEYRQEPVAVGFVTLEMSAEEIMLRMNMGRAGINLLRAKDGFIRDRETIKRITTTNAELGKSPIYILDTGKLSIQELGCIVRMTKNQYPQHKRWLWIVDYLQKISSDTRAAQGNKYIEISQVSGGLKALAKEVNDPFIVPAQINRDAEKNKSGRPQMSQLREGGDIEQDADIVGLLYRPAYYLDCPADECEDSWDEKSFLILDKNRNGGTGDIPMRWKGPLARYESVTNKLNSNAEAEQQNKSK